MASTSSYLSYDFVQGEIETLSIYNCIFCNKLLDGKSKLLDCLHVICNDCVNQKLDNSGKLIFYFNTKIHSIKLKSYLTLSKPWVKSL